MNFEFNLSTRIIFGKGTSQNIGKLVADYGLNILCIYARGVDLRQISNSLNLHHINSSYFEIDREPTLEILRNGIILGQKQRVDAILAVGGGSALDGAKAISAFLTNPGDMKEYLEIIGNNQPIRVRPKPVIAIPTTAGTGAEVTRNAVLSVPTQKLKVSLRSPMLAPGLAIIDPELTYSLPDSVTASTGMDAITQVLEPYVSKKHNMMVDPFCLEGLRLGAKALIDAYHTHNPGARQMMSWCSLLGGMALSNAGLGAVHGFASPMGGMFEIPHGVICACLLSHVFKMNYQKLQSREPDNELLDRFRMAARCLTGNQNANLDDGFSFLLDLTKELKIPTLRQNGIQRSDFPAIVNKAEKASSMQTNPVVLTNSELTEILERAY